MRFLLSILVFSSATFGSVKAASCIDGFDLVNDAMCVKLVTDQVTRDVARRECNLMGAHLVTIENQIENNAIFKMVMSANTQIWLGLCVLMPNEASVKGFWYSVDCEQPKAGYICEIDPVDTCVEDTLKGYCYWAIGDLTKDEAVNACAKTCGGQIASIHNDAENTMTSYGAFGPNGDHGPIGYARIGAQLSSNNLNSWIDNSTWDFSNIGYQNSHVGSCYSISLRDQEVARGRWISADCDYQMPTVCRRRSDAKCPITPSQCTTPTYLSTANSTSVESPNYPYPYCTNPVGPCYYVLSGPSNTNLSLRFPIFNLDTNSTISLYSSLSDAPPFKILSSSNFDGTSTWYNSPSNIIKIVFNDRTIECNSTTAIYSWKAEFQTSTTTVLN
ncbi:unnamed protein product [Caenorhabditis angaria]|uniref:C-type lectin domain-containing protein n=1 Tax=Caenorhabditis angaria TaxID=860376 RepID=A0A9P1I8R9_9PELO|nr:unnamed protein product [Caenorhabditis angaria]